jgi:FOG: Ankyrin repeat
MSDLELIEAVKANDYETAVKLIEKGVDVNQQDQQGWAPLNFAAGKGSISLVQLLVEKGADLFRTGRDRRTPYMIALAAGRVEVAKYLRTAVEACGGKKTEGHQLKYCKGYRLGSLRKYPDWNAGRVVREQNNQDTERTDRLSQSNNLTEDGPLSDDKVVFIHQDYSVTESIWHNENVLFVGADSAWKEFCTEFLKFKVPDDLDMIVPNQSRS